MSKTVLHMNQISKSFGGVKVLNQVDFTLMKGEVHALVGGNGAGKSTLMKIMTGVYTKDTGDIVLDDQKIELANSEAASKKGISMICQELSLVQSMTVAENIFLGDEIKQGAFLSKAKMIKISQEILAKLGLTLDPTTKVEELSVGLSQMVENAKAISKDARILVFDEPTASLSETETQRLFQLIAELKSQGVSIVYISHRMNEIMEIADRITVLKDGKVAMTEEIRYTNLADVVSYFVSTADSSETFKWKKRVHSGENLLTVEDLCINEKINNISFEVHKGEIVGIAGLMGSGRTEILEGLFGIGPKKSGVIKIEGEEQKISNAKEGISAGFGLVPEDRRKQGLVLNHTVKANNILPILNQLRKYKLVIDEQRSKELTEQNMLEFNVKSSGIDIPINLLSGGNQQKIVISKWLNTHPKVMLLDEPTAGVDIGAKSEIIDIMRDFADKGNGVVLVSSELTELLAACDRVLVLYDGKIIKEMQREDILSEEELQHAVQAG